MKHRYTVVNKYDIQGESYHEKVEAALKARDKREGEGWQVVDLAGNIWERDFDGKPQIVSRAIFGRLTPDGDVALFNVEYGDAITQLEMPPTASIYPINSDLSTDYEHPEGIVISKEDAEFIGVHIEGE